MSVLLSLLLLIFCCHARARARGLCVCVCVCVCVCDIHERSAYGAGAGAEREREGVCTRLCACACMHLCARRSTDADAEPAAAPQLVPPAATCTAPLDESHVELASARSQPSVMSSQSPADDAWLCAPRALAPVEVGSAGASL